VLAESEFYRVGGTVPIKVDVRVVAATHQDLSQAVIDGSFREDLYHRLNVMRIEVPPLRERREDIPMLTRTYLEIASNELGVPMKSLSREAAAALSNYDWPGNVRELVNICRRLTVTAAGREIALQDLPPEMSGEQRQQDRDWTTELRRWADTHLSDQSAEPLLDTAVPAFERVVIEAALQASHGKRREAAKLLGWGRNTLTRKIKELSLED
jgi:two-component system nitrogen regulation response regulator GlnG